MIALLLPLLSLAAPELAWPPGLPDGVAVAGGSSPRMLERPPNLRDGVGVAATAPTVDFLYYDCQTYEPDPGVWSNWGDGCASGSLYYSAIGDHSTPEGNAFVYEYDSEKRTLRRLCDLRSILKQPPGRYTPGKIHSRVDLGSDGWLYFSTHRGSTKIAFKPEADFKGDWILRHHPGTGKSEILAHAPLPMQCLPAGMLDPDRLIFYAGTTDGLNEKPPRFLAFDAKKKENLFSHERGPARYMIFARSTGMLYFHDSKSGPEKLVRFDPSRPDRLVPIDAVAGLRAATEETKDGLVYTIDRDRLWSFNTATEKAVELGPSAVASKDYTASVDVDPQNGRYLYYVPGAHGGAEKDGSPLVQYDVQTRSRKVVCFLHPWLHEQFGYIPMGSYSTAVSPDGSKVYITWNGNRGTPVDGPAPRKIRFNTCALTVVHVPASEREP